VTTASQSAAAAAEQAAERKSLKYAELSAAYEIQPLACVVETHEPMDDFLYTTRGKKQNKTTKVSLKF